MKWLQQIVFLVLPLAVSAADVRGYLGFDPEKEVELAANAYIAQENVILFRMRYPNGSYREFERNFARPDVLAGSQGWKGRIMAADRIVVRTGRDPNGDRWEWTFKSGRCVAFGKIGGKKHSFPYDAPRAAPGDVPPFYFGHETAELNASAQKVKKGRWKGVDKQVAKVLGSKWTKSRRLQWPFPNPNENGFLFAGLALLSTVLFFRSRWWIRALGGVFFLVAVMLLVSTASRGSMLALLAGLLPIAGFRLKAVLRSKAVWTLVALVCVALAVWFCTHDVKLFTRGFKGKSTWSNQVRLEMWEKVPQMMVEAPDGWSFTNVGVGYFSWYQDLNELTMPGSLMNEHLTRLAGYGWYGRFGYLFAWIFGLALLAVVAWRTRNAVPLGVWLAFAVAGWFNPVFVNWMLWIVPVAAGGLFLCGQPWQRISRRFAVWMCAGSALAAVGVLASLYAIGSAAPARGYSIRAAKNRVYVKGDTPRIWVVDDGKALGGILACKDIRGWYVYRPQSPSIGYVRNVEDLPPGKFRRLVLAGDAGDAWMRSMSEGGAEKQRDIPDEVVFISPPFPPSALPEGFLQSCKVKFLVGEFVTRYEAEYQKPPPWVTVVTGMELYHPGWMNFVAGD